MNDTQTDTRDLDSWLAEHLFGCVRRDDGEWWEKARGIAAWMRVGKTVRAYSTTGDGMLLVLEAMADRGWRCDVEHDVDQKWAIDFVDASGDIASGFRRAATLPLAVARAASAALSAEASR